MFMEFIAESPRNAFFVICLLTGLLLFGSCLYLNPGKHEKAVRNSQDPETGPDKIYRIK